MLYLFFISTLVLIVGFTEFLKLKRGYRKQSDIVTVTVILSYTGIVCIALYVSVMGYILSVSNLLR